MSGTGASVSPNAISSSVVEITARPSRTGAPLFVKISTNGGSGCGLAANCSHCDPPPSCKGPSCVFVGPLETANKETLEALYLQARDAYYSGAPIIVDDMFDRVELILRWYGSKSVVKYPRCSLRRQSTYADAEADSSQVFALASIWILILAFGSSACLAPIIYTVTRPFQDAFSQGVLYYNQSFAFEFLSMVNAILFMALGSAIGYPIASASVKVLQGLWRNDLVALKGPCPNCGEQVFAFVQSDQFKNTSHRANCHVCECYLEFRTTVEQSISSLGRNWVHGRIYLVSQGGRSRHQRFM